MFPVVRAASVFVGVGVFLSLPLLSPAKADIGAFPPDFRTEDVKAGDAVIHVRVGGHGPAIVMLHGFGDSGDMWAPLAAEMAKDHTVVVPDLRGMGLSSHPAGGYDKKTQANDVAAVLDKLGIRRADLVTHDIGNMVGYAFAAQFADRVTRWVAMDAPLPGIGNWDKIVLSPLLWHFNFRGPDVERLVQGRERIIWTGSGMNCPPIQKRSTRRHASTIRQSTPGPARCIQRLNNSPRFLVTPRTTRLSQPTAS